ncbi:spore germination protein [Pradoshia sp. D12]|nr:spore germination protein [Pradoshia sp. D12]TPF71636.1 spore germination protein [Bacillus sp. D12]
MDMKFFKKRTTNQTNEQVQSNEASTPDIRSLQTTCHVEDNIEKLKTAFSSTQDFDTRYFSNGDQKYGMAFIKTIVKKDIIDHFLIEPLVINSSLSPANLPVAHVSAYTCFEDIINNMLDGNIALFKEGDTACYLVEAADFKTRSIEEPASEQSIRGSHEGFVEKIEDNLNLIRKRVKTENLVVKTKTLGSYPKATAALFYINGKADPEVIEKIEKKLDSIHLDTAINTEVIQNYIEDSVYSPFPQILNTEKPNRVAHHLSMGAVGLMTEGSSTVFLMPITFFTFFHAADDIESRFYISSFERILRLFALFLAITLPSFYIALVSFDFEIIPLNLVANVKGSLENIPYSPLIEALIMVVILELLKESAIRLPSSVSPTIGVVGALVIGTAIVQANLVSNTMLIVIAITAISAFTIPNQEVAQMIRILNFPLIIITYIFGLVGIAIGFTLIIYHLCELESMGKPYLAPVAPFNFKSLSKMLFKIPFKKES